MTRAIRVDEDVRSALLADRREDERNFNPAIWRALDRLPEIGSEAYYRAGAFEERDRPEKEGRR